MVKDKKKYVLELPMTKSPVARSFICTFGNEASLVRGGCSVKLNDIDDDSYDSSIAHSSESFQKRKNMVSKGSWRLAHNSESVQKRKIWA